jgi:hypothetical protein
VSENGNNNLEAGVAGFGGEALPHNGEGDKTRYFAVRGKIVQKYRKPATAR